MSGLQSCQGISVGVILSKPKSSLRIASYGKAMSSTETGKNKLKALPRTSRIYIYLYRSKDDLQYFFYLQGKVTIIHLFINKHTQRKMGKSSPSTLPPGHTWWEQSKQMPIPISASYTLDQGFPNFSSA